MIWIIIFTAGVMILIISGIQNRTLNKKYDNDLNTAFDNLRYAQERMEKVSKPIYDSILNLYGKDFVDKISKGVITTDMPKELLILSWGKPGDIKNSFYKGNKSEQWFYEMYINRLGNTKYKTEVILENDKITGWKDIG
jgi:hypothetical protein